MRSGTPGGHLKGCRVTVGMQSPEFWKESSALTLFSSTTYTVCISLSSLILPMNQSLLPLLEKFTDPLQNASVPVV